MPLALKFLAAQWQPLATRHASPSSSSETHPLPEALACSTVFHTPAHASPEASSCRRVEMVPSAVRPIRPTPQTASPPAPCNGLIGANPAAVCRPTQDPNVVEPLPSVVANLLRAPSEDHKLQCDKEPAHAVNPIHIADAPPAVATLQPHAFKPWGLLRQGSSPEASSMLLHGPHQPQQPSHPEHSSCKEPLPLPVAALDSLATVATTSRAAGPVGGSIVHGGSAPEPNGLLCTESPVCWGLENATPAQLQAASALQAEMARPNRWVMGLPLTGDDSHVEEAPEGHEAPAAGVVAFSKVLDYRSCGNIMCVTKDMARELMPTFSPVHTSGVLGAGHVTLLAPMIMR